jgi:anti-sigma factor RsiW
MRDCRTVREKLVGYAAGRLPAAERAEVAAHLEGCAGCRGEAAVEAEIGAALDRLPRHPAPAALKRRLEALIVPEALAAGTASSTALPPAPSPMKAAPRGGPARWEVWTAAFVSACAAAALVLLIVRLPARPSAGAGPADLVAEAVNDHLRVVGSTRPIEIESGGIHQVKPWFTGRLEFAPRVAFSGDDDFPLMGGSLGYFHDRKAAVMVFKRRLHTITLLIFPPEGLVWPAENLTRLGHLSVTEATSRGFSVLFWRDGGLGYALVSDVNSHDLETLASKINPE